VVAAQAQDAFGLFGVKFDHVGHGAGHVVAAVDDVAEQDEHVARRVARDHPEDAVQLRAPPVYVADDESPHLTSTRPLSPCRRPPAPCRRLFHADLRLRV
jgi:hypothetical protein